MKCVFINISIIVEFGLYKMLDVVKVCVLFIEIVYVLKWRNNFKICKLVKSRLEKNICIFLFLKIIKCVLVLIVFLKIFLDFLFLNLGYI